MGMRHPKRPGEATLRRLAAGTDPPYCVDPVLSAKRRAAGIAGRMKQLAAQGKTMTIRIDPRQLGRDVQHLLPALANGQILPRSYVLGRPMERVLLLRLLASLDDRGARSGKLFHTLNPEFIDRFAHGTCQLIEVVGCAGDFADCGAVFL
ncbi:MAG: hypothetical protein Q8O52_03360 [Sulfuritalea sp.]|nr:hypothetical protein [Sulfuritalea sp.]